jgi:hypothetical protein
VRSSPASPRSAVGDSSIFHAIPLHDFLDGNCFAAALAECDQFLLGQVHIFQILKMIQDSLSDVPGLRAPGSFGQAVQARFDVCRETDSEHK